MAVAENGAEKMRAFFALAALPLAVALTTATADAKGCIKGAVVGGVAAHVAGHHTLLAAAAGCVIGRHLAKQHEQQEREQNMQAAPGNGATPASKQP
jgi:outer membrane lipoprotein SlyB